MRLAEIDNMGVTPAFRSKGIGIKLVEAYRQWAKEHGFDRLYVNAYYQNIKAIEFYKKCGLSPIDISLEGAV
ncbi:MAG: GCN5-related N-acetyltransferase [Candidatus Gottesmanbacteria bacterium GW2011_GWA2_47_9]|uniref:GCN5-related N-acetyltransferase n=1 Tax=Candidatus Gottesmanbacteria bacterium GW2011_GWA2_47_9 TaxID=1618445 RepID=A0A0G1U0E7_9BACT|nr:MAG: GCN5-related N-acetyltransferase [Candidatus Gottesmanbacteria bacterium GW2011_GWA2_47_9]